MTECEFTPRKKPLAPNQMGYALFEIGEGAKQIAALSVAMRHTGEDEMLFEALQGAIGSLAQRIGLIADIVAQRQIEFMGHGPIMESLEQWVMPAGFQLDDLTSDPAGANDAPLTRGRDDTPTP